MSLALLQIKQKKQAAALKVGATAKAFQKEEEEKDSSNSMLFTPLEQNGSVYFGKSLEIFGQSHLLVPLTKPV